MKTATTLYWTLLEHNGWKLHMAATAAGVCYIGSAKAPFEEMEEWADRKFSAVEWVNDFSLFETHELIDYLEGRRMDIGIPADLHGTDFQQQVWKKVMEIPYGETASYMDIAKRLGRPSAVRAVGGAIGANPVLFIVPCHRIIAKSGKLTGFRGGLPMKESLLRLESESIPPGTSL